MAVSYEDRNQCPYKEHHNLGQNNYNRRKAGVCIRQVEPVRAHTHTHSQHRHRSARRFPHMERPPGRPSWPPDADRGMSQGIRSCSREFCR